MKVLSSDRTGLLILRLWIEANHETGLRARITQTLDTMAGEQPVAVAASADDICAIVKQWVQAFEDAAPRDGNGRVTPAGEGDGS
jgi:hypothetical protein